jgi:hypothetical protein
LTKHERLLRLEKATAERAITLTEEQTQALERFSPEFRKRHIEAPHTVALVAVDAFSVGTLKGVGEVYLQTGLVAYLYRSDCSFRLLGVRKPGGFCLPTLNACGADY